MSLCVYVRVIQLFFLFIYNILCIKQRIHKIATEANTSAYPKKKKKMIKYYDKGTLQCKIN